MDWDWKFWLPFIATIIGMWLTYTQVRLMKQGTIASRSSQSFRSSFWPLLIMVGLMILTWLPYLMGLGSSTQQHQKTLILRWGTQPSSCEVAVNGNYLMKFKDQFGIAFTCQLRNSEIDEFEDKRISVSQMFSIRPEVIEMGSAHIEMDQ